MLRWWIPCLLVLVVNCAYISTVRAAVIGSWNFDENNCSNLVLTARDSSGHNLDGTIHGTPGCTAGISGSALTFAGNGEYIEVPTTPLFSPPASLILEASVKLQGLIFTAFSRKNNNGDGISLMVSPYYTILSIDQVGVGNTVIQKTDMTGSYIPMSQWANIMLQIDTKVGKVRYYLNGTLKWEDACPMAPLLVVDAPLRIAGDGVIYSLNGAIDNVRVSTDDPLLTVALTGNGSGSVHSSPTGMDCNNQACSSYFAADTPITLTSTPGAHSVFGGWFGGCAGSTDTCSLTMNASQDVGAQFLTTYPVKVSGTPDNYFDNLSKAYFNSITNTTLVARDGIFSEDFLLDRPFNVTFNGGYDPLFGTIVGRSVIQGAFVIQQGKFVAKNLVVRSPSSPVSYAIPSDGAVDVAVTSPVQVKKAEQLDPDSVSSATVSLWGKGRFGSFRIPGQVTYNQTLRRIAVHHGGLQTGISYVLRLSGLRNSAGDALTGTTIAFSTLKNQINRTVYYNANGSVNRYLLFPQDADGWVQGNAEYVAPGTDGIWFTSDDILSGSSENLYYTAQQLTGRNTYLWSDYALYVEYVNGADGNLTRETFWPDMGGIYRVTNYSYNTQGSLDRQIHSVSSGADGSWNTADDVVGSYTRFEYDQSGIINREITYRLVTPDGIVLPAEEIVSYISSVYDTQGLLSRKVTYESPGTDGSWFTVDDVVSGYWDYTYTYGQLTRAVYHGQAGTDDTWFTGDDTVFGYVSYTYDASGNRTEAVRYNGSGPDLTWFNVDDVKSVVNTFDSTR